MARSFDRGGKFFVLDRSHWAQLWNVETTNRLNLVTAYLVLLAGTGADHRLTKWSAKACEERAGMGKPRAKIAIEEIIRAGLAERTETSRPSFPQYRLAAVHREVEPIFLPMQLVTGFESETPVLRRVRETGDALVLRMLIDLYGSIQIDAPYGVPLEKLRSYHSVDDSPEAARKIMEMGANAVWSLNPGNTRSGGGEWTAVHAVGTKSKPDWTAFWARLDTLQKIGAVWFEPWVFAGSSWDAEPLFPVDTGSNERSPSVDVKALSRLMQQAALALAADRTYLVEPYWDHILVTLPTHHQPPALRGVARLQVEADTPGRRAAYAKRKSSIESYTAAYEQLVRDTSGGRHDRPIKLA
jgi:hypothetical protein